MYDDEFLTLAELIVPNDSPDITPYGLVMQSKYFEANEGEDPELTHFSLWVMDSDFRIALTVGKIAVIPKGTPICLNSTKTTIGVPIGQARIPRNENSGDRPSIASYPHVWLFPEANFVKSNEPYIEFNSYIQRGSIKPLPEEAGLPRTINTLPELFG